MVFSSTPRPGANQVSAIAGDLPKFDDAVREIYAGNPVGYDHFTHEWPAAIRLHGRTLAFPDR